MDAGTLRDLRTHMEWADAAVWSSVLSCAAATSDARIRYLLHHVHVVQLAFLRSWRHDFSQDYPSFEVLGPLLDWGRATHAETSAHLSNVTDQEASSDMPIAWAAEVEKYFGRKPAPTTMGETALQVVLHSQYHRGQVNTRLRELGGEPPAVDYIVWVWIGRPAPEWPASPP